MNNINILLAEDEYNVRRVISAHLKRNGYNVIEASTYQQGELLLGQNEIDLVITDLRMPNSDDDGIKLLQSVQEFNKQNKLSIPVLILTAYGTADKAIEALALGAYNLISKPCDIKELLLQIENALKAQRGSKQDSNSKQSTISSDGEFGIIGNTEKMRDVFEIIRTIAASPSTVLITGESGTGKELIAHALHYQSSRSNLPFIKINCAAIPENLLESELFGHEKGSFTGANTSKAGKLEQVNGGTLFLDEIGDMKLELQVKLLRCLQEHEIERIGSVKTIKVNFRLVTATNKNLQQSVKDGEFREDLFYRLNVVPIRLPPLRERIEDIPILVSYFQRKYNQKLGKNIQCADKALIAVLQKYSWPGNIRELENILERMILFSDSSILSIRHLPVDLLQKVQNNEKNQTPTDKNFDNAQIQNQTNNQINLTNKPIPLGKQQTNVSLKDLVKEETSKIERDLIVQALNDMDWNITKTAERLGISRKGLQIKVKELDIKK